MHRCHLVFVSLGCISAQDLSIQDMNLMKIITVMQCTALIIENRAKLKQKLKLEATKAYILY